MAEWRKTGEDCPDGRPPASVENCLDCKYNRGVSGLYQREPLLLCNWPRNGSEIAEKWLEQQQQRPPVPSVFYDEAD